jgi:hypothetical protein
VAFQANPLHEHVLWPGVGDPPRMSALQLVIAVAQVLDGQPVSQSPSVHRRRVSAGRSGVTGTALRFRPHSAHASGDPSKPVVARVKRSVLPVVGLLLLTACAGSTPLTNEDLALRACSAELRHRLDISDGATPSQTQMIGRREHGWLVRGLSRSVPGLGAQNYECRLDDGESGRPTLTYLRLCEAGDRPWGCPAGAL